MRYWVVKGLSLVRDTIDVCHGIPDYVKLLPSSFSVFIFIIITLQEDNVSKMKGIHFFFNLLGNQLLDKCV